MAISTGAVLKCSDFLRQDNFHNPNNNANQMELTLVHQMMQNMIKMWENYWNYKDLWTETGQQPVLIQI